LLDFIAINYTNFNINVNQLPPVLTGGFCFNLNWALAKLFGFWLKPFLYTFVYLQLKLEAIQKID